MALGNQNLQAEVQSTSRASTLQLIDASFIFGNDVVLENINVEVQQGEILALVGPSGQGKTTLLKGLCGLVAPTKGKLLVEGNDFHAMLPKQRQALLLKMGILFQKNALFDSLTVGENVAFPLRESQFGKPGRDTESEVQKKVDYFLDAVGLLTAKTLFPDEISGGMQKRLGIARALALKPKIIFYDDPTAGLDPITSRKIIDLIKNLQAEADSTNVIITNDMHRAEQVANQIVVVTDKTIIKSGSPQETRDNKDPRVYYFIRGQTHVPGSDQQETRK